MFDPELKSCEGPRTATKSVPIIYSGGGNPFLSLLRSVARGLVLIERQSDGDLIKERGALARRR